MTTTFLRPYYVSSSVSVYKRGSHFSGLRLRQSFKRRLRNLSSSGAVSSSVPRA